MTLVKLATALGGSVNNGWANVRGPGHSSHDRSLGFRFDSKAPNGIRVMSFAGDDESVCRRHILALLQKVADGTPLNLEPVPEPTEYLRRRINRALAIWDEARPAKGTVVETYLANRQCDLSLAQADVVRFHPACPFRSCRVPAMIAIMRDILTDEPRGIHRTALADDGKGKRSMPDNLEPRMMLGSPKGAAIKLQPHNGHLGVAEGVETSLSAGQIFGTPVWSVMNAPGIQSFPIIPGLLRLTIFADHDEAGLSAARICRRRYRAAGIECEVRYPPLAGSDWNDFIREGHHHAQP